LNQYDTEAAFLAAVGTNDPVNFSEPGSTGAYNSSDGVTITGVQFVGIGRDAGFPFNYDLQIVDEGVNNWDGWYLRGPQLISTQSPSRLRVYLPSNVRYFGSEVMTTNGGSPRSDTVTVVLSTGPTQYQLTTINNLSSTAFIGFQVDGPVQWIDFYSPAGGNNIAIDNFRTAIAPAGPDPDPPIGTPDAATFVLTASGVALIFVRNRRRVEAC